MNPVALRVAVAFLVPVVMASIYFGLFASDRFVSESSVVIRSGNASGPSLSLGGLLPIGGSSVQDVVVVSDYIQSMEMATHLDEKFSLRQHYAATDIDFVSRFDKQASAEAFLKYLSKKVTVVYEETTEIISITTRAFSPQMAREINQEIIRKSEVLINQLSGD